MKRNLILGAAITATLLAGNAQAITVVSNFPVFDTSAQGDTRVVYLSGASAAGTFLEKVFTGAGVAADQICDVTKPIWKFKDNIDGATQKAYLCTQSTTATGLTLPNDKANLLIYKRDEGGSGYGVAPIIAEAKGDNAGAAIEFMKEPISTNCTGVTVATPPLLTTITCNYSSGDGNNNQKVIPDFGISDVDPGAFKGQNAPLKTDNITLFSDVTASDVSLLTVVPGAAVVFGVPATLHLYKALQGAQLAMGTIPVTDPVSSTTCVVGDVTHAACMPSLTKQEIATLIKGDWSNWNKLKVVTGAVGSQASLGLYDWAVQYQAADKPADPATHICRRENGSGTQAQLNNFALNYPCTTASGQTAPASGNDGINGKTESSGVALIHENSTSGRVTACLNNLDQGIDPVLADGFTNTYVGVRWAIGAQALEKKDANFEFVKVNGVAPTLANVANGSYLDWFENTFQYNTNHAKFTTDAGLKLTIDAIIKAASVPAVMASINGGSGLSHGFGNGAYLANPKANTPVATGIFNLSLPINAYSHTPSASVALDNCRAPVVYNKSDVGL